MLRATSVGAEKSNAMADSLFVSRVEEKLRAG